MLLHAVQIYGVLFSVFIAADLFVTSSVLLQNADGVVGPLAFTIEFHSACQTIILHL